MFDIDGLIISVVCVLHIAAWCLWIVRQNERGRQKCTIVVHVCPGAERRIYPNMIHCLKYLKGEMRTVQFLSGCSVLPVAINL